MTSDSTDERLTAFLDGDLDAGEVSRLQQDLLADPALRARYDEIQHAVSLLRTHGPTHAPDDFFDRVMEQVEGLAVPVSPWVWLKRPFGIPFEGWIIAATALVVLLLSIPTSLVSSHLGDGAPSSTAHRAIETLPPSDAQPPLAPTPTDPSPKSPAPSLSIGSAIPTGGVVLVTDNPRALELLLKTASTYDAAVLEPLGNRVTDPTLGNLRTVFLELPAERWNDMFRVLGSLGTVRTEGKEMVGGTTTIQIDIRFRTPVAPSP